MRNLSLLAADDTEQLPGRSVGRSSNLEVMVIIEDTEKCVPYSKYHYSTMYGRDPRHLRKV